MGKIGRAEPAGFWWARDVLGFARLRGLVILTSLIDLTRAITSYTKDPALVFFELCVTVKWLYMLIHSPVFRGRRAYYVLAY